MKYFDHEQDELNRRATIAYWTNWNVTEQAAEYNEALYQEVYEKHMVMYNVKDIEFEHQINPEIQFDFLENYMNCFYHICPDEILGEVADKRLLALGTLTQDTLSKLEKISEAANEQLEILQQEYHLQFQKAIHMLSPEGKFSMQRSFHDSKLLDLCADGPNPYLILRLCNGEELLENQYIKLSFISGVIVEGSLHKSLDSWIYEELYYEGDHFELHVRFSGGNVILGFQDIKSECIHSYLASDYPLPELENNEVFFGKRKDLIALGHISEDTTMHPWLELMSEEEAMNLQMIHMNSEDSLGKLTVKEIMEPIIQDLTQKKYCYQIDFINEWRILWENRHNMLEEPEKSWIRGKEILDYINTHLQKELELWIIWSDHQNAIQYHSYPIDGFSQNYLEGLYQETTEVIVTNRCITLVK